MTHEQFITLETARLAKQAGFDWKCKNYYVKVTYNREDEYELEEDYHWGARDWSHEWEGYYSAPTQAVLQRWLREEKKIDVQPEHLQPREKDNIDAKLFYWCYSLEDITQWAKISGMPEIYNTYEDALEAGLQKCLTLLIETLL